MRISISNVVSNPFRDFGLYPIDEEQVEKLVKSIGELGFFSGVTARKVGDVYELACGHHRVEAADRAGLGYIEAVVDNYTDEQMVRILCAENATQRGASQASINDSVAAQSRLTIRERLLDGKEVPAEGLDPHTLYKAINRPDGPLKGELLSTTQIKNALQSLVSSGHMAWLISQVYGEVQQIRRKQDAEAAAARAAEEARRQKAVAEAERRVEEERQQAILRVKARQAAEEKARIAAEKARTDAKAKREAAEAARAADAARAEEKAVHRRQAIAEAEAKQERDRALAAARKAEEAMRRESQRRVEEADAIEKLRHVPQDYDARCDQVFGNAVQAVAFRTGVLSTMGRNFLALNQQYAFAEYVRKELVVYTKQSGQGDPNSIGSVALKDIVQRELMKIARAQSDADKAAEAQAAERESARQRVIRQWGELKHATTKMTSAMAHIHDAHKEWPYEDEPFPIDMSALAEANYLAKIITSLAKEMGLNPSAQTEDANDQRRIRAVGFLTN